MAIGSNPLRSTKKSAQTDVSRQNCSAGNPPYVTFRRERCEKHARNAKKYLYKSLSGVQIEPLSCAFKVMFTQG
jgi:hypothetical protein